MQHIIFITATVIFSGYPLFLNKSTYFKQRITSTDRRTQENPRKMYSLEGLEPASHYVRETTILSSKV